MTAPFSARRRADEFEALLSRDPTAPSGRDAERYADLLDVVADLRAVPPVAARPEFVASLREQLMAGQIASNGETRIQRSGETPCVNRGCR